MNADYIGYVYKITCIPTGRCYVGSKVSPVFVESYWSSSKNTEYWNDLKHYKKNQFKREILAWCWSLEDLRNVERHYILFENALVSQGGYNQSYGAHSIIFTDNVRQKQSIKRKQYWEQLSPEKRKQFSDIRRKLALDPNGTMQSPEYKERMRKICTGRKMNLTEQQKEELRERGYNQICSRETRLHLSEIRQGHCLGKHWWNNGKAQKFCQECPGDGWVQGRLNPHWNQRNYMIYCIELQKEFNTYNDAAKFICKDPIFLESTARQISRRCTRKDNRLVGGYHWKRIEKE